MAWVALLPAERLLPECKSGFEQLMLPVGSLRGRDLGPFLCYMTQEIYGRPEGSTENILDLLSAGNACVRHAIGHAVLALLSHYRSRLTEASVSQEKDTHVLSPASLEGVRGVALAGDAGVCPVICGPQLLTPRSCSNFP